MLDQGITTALWGARRPGQLQPVDEVFGWSLDAFVDAEIDRILSDLIKDPPRSVRGMRVWKRGHGPIRPAVGTICAV
jgi:hypothetical protein